VGKLVWWISSTRNESVIASSSTEDPQLNVSFNQCQEHTNPRIHNAMPLWESANHRIRTYTCKHSRTCTTKPNVGLIPASLDPGNHCNTFTVLLEWVRLSPASTDGPIPCTKIPTKCLSFIYGLFNEADYPVISIDWLKTTKEQFRSRFELGTSRICEKCCHVSQLARYQMYEGVVMKG
jgi:hypothetical protein